MWKEAYKIFDLYIDADGLQHPKTLFHGLNGSRLLEVDSTKEDVAKWINGAKNIDNRVVVKVRIKGIRNKDKAVRPTMLANYMKISRENWANRIAARDFVIL